MVFGDNAGFSKEHVGDCDRLEIKFSESLSGIKGYYIFYHASYARSYTADFR